MSFLVSCGAPMLCGRPPSLPAAQQSSRDVRALSRYRNWGSRTPRSITREFAPVPAAATRCWAPQLLFATPREADGRNPLNERLYGQMVRGSTFCGPGSSASRSWCRGPRPGPSRELRRSRRFGLARGTALPRAMPATFVPWPWASVVPRAARGSRRTPLGGFCAQVRVRQRGLLLLALASTPNPRSPRLRRCKAQADAGQQQGLQQPVTGAVYGAAAPSRVFRHDLRFALAHSGLHARNQPRPTRTWGASRLFPWRRPGP